MKFSKCVSPSGELVKLKQERRAVYPQQPTRALMGSGNTHLSFDETMASSSESTPVQTPWWQRSKGNHTEGRLLPTGTGDTWLMAWLETIGRCLVKYPRAGGEVRAVLPPIAAFGLLTPRPCPPGTCSFCIVTKFKGIRNSHGRGMRRNSQVCTYSNFLAALCLCR